jgi:hypothetical protein
MDGGSESSGEKEKKEKFFEQNEKKEDGKFTITRIKVDG